MCRRCRSGRSCRSMTRQPGASSPCSLVVTALSCSLSGASDSSAPLAASTAQPPPDGGYFLTRGEGAWRRLPSGTTCEGRIHRSSWEPRPAQRRGERPRARPRRRPRGVHGPPTVGYGRLQDRDGTRGCCGASTGPSPARPMRSSNGRPANGVWRTTCCERSPFGNRRGTRTRPRPPARAFRTGAAATWSRAHPGDPTVLPWTDRRRRLRL